MEIYTKEDFKQIFIDLGINKGSFVLLEAAPFRRGSDKA